MYWGGGTFWRDRREVGGRLGESTRLVPPSHPSCESHHHTPDIDYLIKFKVCFSPLESSLYFTPTTPSRRLLPRSQPLFNPTWTVGCPNMPYTDLHTDDLCYRLIDGMKFPAKILAVQPNDRYRIQFLDDNGVEDGVDGGEVEPMETGGNEEGKGGEGNEEEQDIEKWKKIASSDTVGKKVIRTAQPGDDIPENLYTTSTATTSSSPVRKPLHEQLIDDPTIYDPQGNAKFFAKGDAPPKVTVHNSNPNSYRGWNSEPGTPVGGCEEKEGFNDNDESNDGRQRTSGGLGEGSLTSSRANDDDDRGGITAFTIQGDQPLPRGGGLRALRALRK